MTLQVISKRSCPMIVKWVSAKFADIFTVRGLMQQARGVILIELLIWPELVCKNNWISGWTDINSSVEPLSLSKISKYFSSQPEHEYLHIIVQRPTVTVIYNRTKKFFQWMVSIGDSRNGVFGRVEGESETVEDVTVDVENVEAQQPFHSYTFLRMNELPKHVLYSGNIIDSCIKEDVLGDVVREILRKHTASRIIRADVNEATNYLWCINLLWYCKDIS
ncbi:hypothetical protein GLOIN_2v1822026 [Rhizophagus irregularis DAOM 181602=DAOM 197198]|uniref:Uncharacterized protein n=1 Tax=Rhizophagus irregularis (strain DAOM 181602 / DAOM 197198 / MUCL 43194) TaxID=747089 RepID=A0A2P4QE81_RHIID|nr:hypothetical protein GLOIN_2v1822026 [Rhizophagus irregularis DAOM 181602=DAOM 197198]POG75952.1 hypothetical protein GLOIN_2v1822026 [Rhizophagus irregularis DAOM 181602=DAOM 197198]|eukprot:XP_025182818.1 hypothetical protein GLOIN_2v1822026 [Rhizophagus irregularis DAOM 181602=DAOM 197198]